jgi:hypothetical protein
VVALLRRSQTAWPGLPLTGRYPEPRRLRGDPDCPTPPPRGAHCRAPRGRPVRHTRGLSLRKETGGATVDPLGPPEQVGAAGVCGQARWQVHDPGAGGGSEMHGPVARREV